MSKRKLISNRENWVDAVKGIGIILMVIGHTRISDNIKLWIYAFHMPLFFIIAGYTFNKDKWLSEGYKRLIKNRAQRYLIPYAVLFVINLVSYSALEILGGRYQANNIIIYIIAGLYSHDTAMPNCAPLWFLTCLFVSYSFFWILIKQRIYVAMFLAVIYIGILQLLCKLEITIGITQLPWHVDVALVASIFMYIGYLLKSMQIITRSKISYAIVCFGVGSVVAFSNGRINMVQNQYQNIWIFLVGAICLSVAVMTVGYKLTENYGRFGGAMGYLGRNTLIFMGFNYLINVIVRQISKWLHFSDAIYSILDFLCVVIICLVLSHLWKKIKLRTIHIR